MQKQPASKPYYVYMLMCRGDRLYTGITTDLERRLTEHNAGKRGARFTRANTPVNLLAARQVDGRSEALKLEAAIKKLSRPQKLCWANEHPVPNSASNDHRERDMGLKK